MYFLLLFFFIQFTFEQTNILPFPTRSKPPTLNQNQHLNQFQNAGGLLLISTWCSKKDGSALQGIIAERHSNFFLQKTQYSKVSTVPSTTNMPKMHSKGESSIVTIQNQIMINLGMNLADTVRPNIISNILAYGNKMSVFLNVKIFQVSFYKENCIPNFRTTILKKHEWYLGITEVDQLHIAQEKPSRFS